MVDEYLDEKEQAELLKQWFKENWLWLAAGIGLGLGLLYGWQGYNAYLDGRSRDAGQRFVEMLQAFDRSDPTRGRELADEITGKYGSTPYADQTRLLLARLHVDAGELDQAAALLRNVMEQSSDSELALVARLRLTRVQLAQGNFAAAESTLDGAASPALAPAVDELRGDILLAKGDKAAALAAYQQARTADQTAAVPGLIDTGLLQLKIDELSGAAGQEKP